MMTTFKIYLGELNGTPFGDFRLAATDAGLIAVEWADRQPELDSYLQKFKGEFIPNQKKLAPYVKELREYFSGKRKEFSAPIDWSPFTPFQRKALQAVFRVPYGETRTYKDIAQKIGHPNAYRAVGSANATNPVPIVVPCHRILGSDGKLHGYGGGDGLPTKIRLLALEGVIHFGE
ncbi:MAG: methylated-DNA--[protein]-cysteine S-methyltransferase [Anaerolineales bacterium]|nr:methylated-DNA--[protein]-cysteine S-methyltransferase [Anaerolineales bacterium]